MNPGFNRTFYDAVHEDLERTGRGVHYLCSDSSRYQRLLLKRTGRTTTFEKFLVLIRLLVCLTMRSVFRVCEVCIGVRRSVRSSLVTDLLYKQRTECTPYF